MLPMTAVRMATVVVVVVITVTRVSVWKCNISLANID